MKLNPGDKAPKTCSCCLCNKDGEVIDRVDVEEGKRLPPTQDPSYYYDIKND